MNGPLNEKGKKESKTRRLRVCTDSVEFRVFDGLVAIAAALWRLPNQIKLNSIAFRFSNPPLRAVQRLFSRSVRGLS